MGLGNIFTSVCQDFCLQWGMPPGLLPGERGAWSRGGAGSWGVPGGDPPGTATAVGGTHPTGMHSCWSRLCVFIAAAERQKRKRRSAHCYGLLNKPVEFFRF